ncbi:hypothetical protein [Parafrankia irregularis]|uniref:hypothetical protein n=1 Tax=Parafrankia irregularis TaxID=795642 RepID=UPI001041CE3A|nr:hypothetical protein [Parafrankia irregularis]
MRRAFPAASECGCVSFRCVLGDEHRSSSRRGERRDGALSYATGTGPTVRRALSRNRSRRFPDAVRLAVPVVSVDRFPTPDRYDPTRTRPVDPTDV